MAAVKATKGANPGDGCRHDISQVQEFAASAAVLTELLCPYSFNLL
jgi:hypothetical protein